MAGVYWMLDFRGAPSDRKKQTYSQAFAIYAFTEYHQAAGGRLGLALARELFRLVESKTRDTIRGGYLDACAADWGALTDMRLGAEDMNAPKTMNTHLHVLEAYTTLHASLGRTRSCGRRSSTRSRPSATASSTRRPTTSVCSSTSSGARCPTRFPMDTTSRAAGCCSRPRSSSDPIGLVGWNR